MNEINAKVWTVMIAFEAVKTWSVAPLQDGVLSVPEEDDATSNY